MERAMELMRYLVEVTVREGRMESEKKREEARETLRASVTVMMKNLDEAIARERRKEREMRRG